MIEIDQLPLTDWGLCCPGCDAPLAGMTEHRCARCGRHFNIRQLLGLHRPVLDFGFTCQECGYPLRGLPGDRCPECGTKFSIREMLEDFVEPDVGFLAGFADPPDHHVKRREPAFTGHERPVPDFGLCCRNCESPLAGATGVTCLHCFEPFDLMSFIPPGDLVNIGRLIPLPIGSMTRNILYQEGIPYVVGDAGLDQIYAAVSPFASRRLFVPREFFFDALHALVAAAKQAAFPAAGPDWTCPTCHEPVPINFDVCWNCNTPRLEDPAGTTP